MNGDGIFNAQILVDKLAKLNSSQQSIETLSHWCISHTNKAKQVVETWERQFHCSPMQQRVYFLYLANDILQNSRRKGMEFVGEFWSVLPQALNDVIENSDEFGRKAAMRLVDIWEARKVFSPRGQNLKEDFLGKNRNGKSISYKPKQPTEDMLEKLILSYRHAFNSYDEDTLLGKCRAAVSAVEKVEKEFGTGFNLGNINGSGAAEELQVQRGLLSECIEQLKVAESCRTTLTSHLREALNEQELKVEQLQTQLQVAQVRYEQVGRLLTGQAPVPPPLLGQNIDVIPPPPPASVYSEAAPPPPGFPPESLSASGVVQNLTSSSAHMLTYVLSSLASEGVIGNYTASEDYISSDPIKRPRLDNGGGLSNMPCYLPQPPPLFPHPDSMLQPTLPPHPFTLSSFPPPPPPAPYGYGSAPMQPAVMPGYPMAGVPSYPGPPNPNYHFQGSDGGGYIVQPPFPGGPSPIPWQYS